MSKVLRVLKLTGCASGNSKRKIQYSRTVELWNTETGENDHNG